MATRFHLRVWTRFHDPPARVWEIKTSAACLRREFPPWAPFTGDLDAFQAALQSGRATSLDARVLGSVDWPVQLEDIRRGARYTDRSQNTLYHEWRHDHIFEKAGDGTRYIDAVTFTPALAAGKLQAVLTERFFVRRHKAAADLLSADQRTIGVSVLRVATDEDDD